MPEALQEGEQEDEQDDEGLGELACLHALALGAARPKQQQPTAHLPSAIDPAAGASGCNGEPLSPHGRFSRFGAPFCHIPHLHVARLSRLPLSHSRAGLPR